MTEAKEPTAKQWKRRAISAEAALERVQDMRRLDTDMEMRHSRDAALAHDQCRAVVHLARAIAKVYTANASIVAADSRLSDQIGYASARALEWLGDELNSTDAADDDDLWVDPIIEAAQARWPILGYLPPPARKGE